MNKVVDLCGSIFRNTKTYFKIPKGKPMIKLGSKVRDNITGFEGIAVSRVEFLHGCARICIQPQGLHEGKPIESQYFDEQQVELVEEKPVVVSEQSRAKTGGPYDAPARNADPKR